MGNTALQQMNFIKFLCVIIDDKLKFICHISYIKNKISKGMAILLKARNYLNKTALINLYNSFIYPHLIYCIEVYGEVHLEPLMKHQNKIICIISFSHYRSSVGPLQKSFKLLSQKIIAIHRIALKMYKYSHWMLPTAIQLLFTNNNTAHEYNTGQKICLRLPWIYVYKL